MPARFSYTPRLSAWRRPGGPFPVPAAARPPLPADLMATSTCSAGEDNRIVRFTRNGALSLRNCRATAGDRTQARRSVCRFKRVRVLDGRRRPHPARFHFVTARQSWTPISLRNWDTSIGLSRLSPSARATSFSCWTHPTHASSLSHQFLIFLRGAIDSRAAHVARAKEILCPCCSPKRT